MTELAKLLLHKLTLILHHLGCGVSGAIAFGATAYYLDLINLKTTLDFGLPLDSLQVLAFGVVFAIFMAFDWAMRPVVGKPGSF